MAQNEIPWPGNRSKAFVELMTGPLYAFLDFFKYLDDDFLLAEGFKESADMIISQIEEKKNGAHPDNYFFPIAYLYRHGIELALKHLINLGTQLHILEETDNKLKELLGGHTLYPLWHKVRQVLIEVWPDGNPDDLKNVERLIQEFHEIDRSGQNFRYSKDKNGNSTKEKLPKGVHLGQLKKACTELFLFFDGCDAGLSATIDSQNEMRDYCN